MMAALLPPEKYNFPRIWPLKVVEMQIWILPICSLNDYFAFVDWYYLLKTGVVFIFLSDLYV